MTVYRLKVLTCSDEHSKSYLKDLYFNMEDISGFYVPEVDEEDLHLECGFVFICHFGEWTSIKLEKHVIDYLNERFVKKAITKTQHD